MTCKFADFLTLFLSLLADVTNDRLVKSVTQSLQSCWPFFSYTITWGQCYQIYVRNLQTILLITIFIALWIYIIIFCKLAIVQKGIIFSRSLSISNVSLIILGIVFSIFINKICLHQSEWTYHIPPSTHIVCLPSSERWVPVVESAGTVRWPL